MAIQVINLTAKKDLWKLLIKEKGKYIGHGKTSCCFLLKDGTVLKIYRETLYKKNLFSCYPMLGHIKFLSTLKNDSYVTPELVFVCEGEVVGYKTEYKNAKTLAKINMNMEVGYLLDNLEKLIEDTYLVSGKCFILGDLHAKNMLFNKYFSVIDLDFGSFKKQDINSINRVNVRKIMKVILDSLFGVKDDEALKIYDTDLEYFYKKAIYEDYKNIYEFFACLQDSLNVSSLQVKDLKLKRNFLIGKENNNYYRHY